MHDSCMHHFHDSFIFLHASHSCQVRARKKNDWKTRAAYCSLRLRRCGSSILNPHAKKVDIGHHRQHITYIRAESGEIKSKQIKTNQKKTEQNRTCFCQFLVFSTNTRQLKSKKMSKSRCQWTMMRCLSW